MRNQKEVAELQRHLTEAMEGAAILGKYDTPKAANLAKAIEIVNWILGEDNEVSTMIKDFRLMDEIIQ